MKIIFSCYNKGSEEGVKHCYMQSTRLKSSYFNENSTSLSIIDNLSQGVLFKKCSFLLQAHTALYTHFKNCCTLAKLIISPESRQHRLDLVQISAHES